MKSEGSVIYWFRKGLRLHDNPALIDALMLASASGKTLRFVYIFDPWYTKIRAHRYRFLIQSLHDLHESLCKIGSRLFVFKGIPKDIFKTYFRKWETLFITWENEREPYPMERDEEIKQLAASMSIGVSTHDSHTLYETGVVSSHYDGKVPLTYKKFRLILKSLDPPAKPVTTLTVIPDTCKISDKEVITWNCDIPTLRDMVGIDDAALEPTNYPGGESEGLRRLEEELSIKHKPSSFLEPSVIDLTPYLSFGCVSPRTIYWKIKEKYKGVSPSKLPTSLFYEIIWREFYYSVASDIPNFNQIKDNMICRQIPWDHDSDKVRAWIDGKTGYPFIDAVMTQLKTEGWIHLQVRNVVACFLTRGDLWQSWEEGMSMFEEYLFDADWFLNAANWMRSSVSAFSHQYFRVYSPISFAKKYDPNGEYVKKYLPQLKDFPPQYIYQPWEAPLDIQKRTGCFIGVDYPEPIVEHSLVMKENIKKMKLVFVEKRKAQKRKVQDEDEYTTANNGIWHDEHCRSPSPHF